MGEDNTSRRTVLKGVGAGLAATAVASTASGEQFDEYTVGVRAGRAASVARSRADEVRKEIDLGRHGRVVVGKFSAEARKALRRKPSIKYVEPNYTAHKLGEKLPWGIDRVDADVLHSNGNTGSGATVAVLDTGVDDDHPDLKNNVDPSLGKAFGSECGSEKGGCRFGGEGYNDNACNYKWSDDDDHGSHCSGSVTALNGNGEGVAGGVSTEATIMPVKVLSGCGSGSYADIADGIRYATDNGADVISMSLGGSSGNSTLKDACQYAVDNNVVVVAAAGNDGPCSDCVGYPAAYSTTIAVSATNSSDQLADYSSTGPEVEIAAPGTDVLSTIPPESDTGSTYENGYETFSGTSMATPHVSGAAAQVKAETGLSSNSKIRSRLKNTAEDIGLGSNESGSGLLDAEAAVSGGGGGDSAPSVSWNNPSGGSTVSGTVTVQISASDSEDSDDSLDVTYNVDGGSSRATSYNSTSGYYEDSLDTTTLSDGSHNLNANATDSAGNTSSSSITVTVDNSEDPVAVQTDSASGVSDTTATLNGTLNNLGGASSADVYFEYGQEGGSLPNTTSAQTVSSTGSFSEDVSGLSSGTTYEFRAVADTSDGDSDTGATNTFTTDSGGGCFITTATAGEGETLDSLRRFRDDSMAATPMGRALVWLYYRISPPIAQTLEEHPESRTSEATYRIVDICASLSDAQDGTDSQVKSAAIGVLLTQLYAVGILVGAGGHAGIRARELVDEEE